MHLSSLEKAGKAKLNLEGAKGIHKQVLTSKADGTPTFSFRVFTIELGGHRLHHTHSFEHLNYIIEGRGTVLGQDGIIDHKLYWASVDSELKAYYLMAILNSETARNLAEHLQSRGQWGARDFDKVMLSLPIPQFSSTDKLHKSLVRLAKHAEEIASAVQISEGICFTTARQRIRKALRKDGIAQEIDKLIAQLLKL